MVEERFQKGQSVRNVVCFAVAGEEECGHGCCGGVRKGGREVFEEVEEGEEEEEEGETV